MELHIVRADPAGNITLFVLTPVEGRKARVRAAQALLADPSLGAEQAGFVLPPRRPGALWRLEMMGGEFCGNAARAFGLYVAGRLGLEGAHTLEIEISGMARPLPVNVDTIAGTASAEIPAPVAETEATLAGRPYPVYIFEGITHIIAENVEPDGALLRPLRQCLEETGHQPEALGLMFCDSKKPFMRPLVFVRSTDTTVWESSCGSGSAAFGAWAARNLRDGAKKIALAQPGGIIEVEIEKREGGVRRICIGGPISLGKPIVTDIP